MFGWLALGVLDVTDDVSFQNLCLSVWESEDDLQKLRQDIRQLRSQLNPPPHQQKSELVKRG